MPAAQGSTAPREGRHDHHGWTGGDDPGRAPMTPKLGYTKDGTPVYAHDASFRQDGHRGAAGQRRRGPQDHGPRRHHVVRLRVRVHRAHLACPTTSTRPSSSSCGSARASSSSCCSRSSSSARTSRRGRRTPGPPRRSRTSRTRATRSRRPSDLLDVHTAGGLHDAVQVIIEAITNGKAGAATPPPERRARAPLRPLRARERARRGPARRCGPCRGSRSEGRVASATAAVARSTPAATAKARA